MKEALVSKGTNVRIVDSPVPKPGEDQVLIKVEVSGSNPKDWKYPDVFDKEMNAGDDIAGVVEEVGPGVHEFKVGDRVAAFHQMHAPHGSFGEYAVAWSHSTFHIPDKTSFEEAATIPLAAMTAAFGIYQYLHLPLPWHPAQSPIPLIIYGAASAVGSFAIQLATQSNIHPLICVAGNGIPHVEGLIDKSKGDVVLDYREGDEKLVQNLKAAREKAGGKIDYAFDMVSERGSYRNISQVLDPKGHLTLVLPGKEYKDVPASVNKTVTYVGDAHAAQDSTKRHEKSGTDVGNQEFAHAFFRFFGRGLHKGFFKPHPYKVVPGGLEGVEEGLRDLRNGKASAVKYVFRVPETKGAGAAKG